MAHIIEHFDYKSLLEMMERYLKVLKPGGALIIATPLLSHRFYDDFDHVKPYSPIAIKGFFGRCIHQVQFQSNTELELTDLWIRRRLLLFAAIYILLASPHIYRKSIYRGC